MRSVTGMQFPLILLFTLLTFFSNISNTYDTLTPKQSIKDGETLVSKGNLFELGFFSPGKSKNRYLGIWYKNIESETVVWVANRDNPITDSSGVLKIDEEGKLVLNQESRFLWSTNRSKAANPIAQLLDSGNLVIQEEKNNDPGKYIWQSFDYPTDTLLPGMKLGLDLKTGVNRFLTSWKNADDPSTGDYSFNLNPHGFPEFFLYKGLIRVHRCGPWDGVIFSGVPTMPPFNGFNYSFIVNQEEIYYTFSLDLESIALKLFMNEIGQLQYRLMGTVGYWRSVWYTPKDQCDNYRKCGAYSICHSMNNNFVCDCVKGFEPKYQKNWNSGEWSGGCVPKTQFKCNEEDEFLVLKGIKMPDTSSSVFNKSISLKECEAECRNNCSCTAYANSDIRGGGFGCIVWFGDLIDLRNAEGGQDLYLRVASSKFANPPPLDINYSPPPTVKPHGNGRKKNVSRFIIIPSIIFGIIILASSIFILSRWTKKRKGTKTKIEDLFDLSGTPENCKDTTEVEIPTRGSKQGNTPHLPVFDFEVIANATYNFSDANKLGMGGFGPVYKGTLPGGQVIAVKRLSKSSGQGLKEFKNEVILISKLQHRNLVRLLGCCIEGEEKMLLYEYMPNKSLDSFLFDPTKQGQLNWPKRFHIVEGIARGLLYLHRDSRLKIIHRDLKAGNILLDDEMNPKISDFGMARIFGGNQTLANTNRVVGTYGYMAPEYAMEGRFSEKSDVFSFGVLLLEIVSGKRINQFYLHEQSLSLVGFAWRLWNEGNEIELMDPTLRDSYSTSEVLRCIRIGLLCVQEHAMERPTVSTVVLMLGMDTTHLPTPRQPGFTIESDLSLAGPEMCSVNNVTITEESGR